MELLRHELFVIEFQVGLACLVWDTVLAMGDAGVATEGGAVGKVPHQDALHPLKAGKKKVLSSPLLSELILRDLSIHK